MQGESGRRPGYLETPAESEGAAPLSTARGNLGATPACPTLGYRAGLFPSPRAGVGEKPGSLEAQVADTNFLLSPELVNTRPFGGKKSAVVGTLFVAEGSLELDT